MALQIPIVAQDDDYDGLDGSLLQVIKV